MLGFPEAVEIVPLVASTVASFWSEDLCARERSAHRGHGVEAAGRHADESNRLRIPRSSLRRAAEVDITEPAGQVQHVVDDGEVALEAHEIEAEARATDEVLKNS
jgi:hypothetical protein